MLESVHQVATKLNADGGQFDQLDSLEEVQLLLLRKLSSSLSLTQVDLATKHMGLLVDMAASTAAPTGGGSSEQNSNGDNLALDTLAKMLDIAGVYQETKGNYLLHALITSIPADDKRYIFETLIAFFSYTSPFLSCSSRLPLRLALGLFI